jgi:cleavage stimulation factor subunit 3
MFETFVSKVPAVKAQRVYRYFYEYEAHYGDLAQVYKLEKRMAELYPADKKLEQFSTRYAYHTVDPCKYLPTISPAQQARPKQLIPIPPEAAAAAGLPIPPPPIPPSVPGGAQGFHPHPPSIPPPNARTSSPKRAAADDSDDYSSRARKLPRPDSPVPILKGAAGRRLNQIKQQQAAAAAAAAESRGGQQKDNRRDYPSQRRDGRDRDGNDGGRGGGTGGNRASEPSLPEAITNLLAALPPAHLYNTVMFAPEQMVRLLANVPLPAAPNAGAGAGGYYGN